MERQHKGSNAFTSGWLADEERIDLWVIFPVWVSALILLVESWEHHRARKNTAIYPKDSIPAQAEQENRGEPAHPSSSARAQPRFQSWGSNSLV